MQHNHTDKELINLVLEGQSDYFEMLVERYQKQIFSYLIRFLNFHNEDAKDALNETFLKAYANLATFKQDLRFFSWLYRIAHNEAVNIIKHKSKHYTIEIKEYDQPINFDFDKPDKHDLEAVLNQLQEKDRQILILFYLQELSIEEISEILKITKGNVKVRLNRARNKAKSLVGNEPLN